MIILRAGREIANVKKIKEIFLREGNIEKIIATIIVTIYRIMLNIMKSSIY